MSTSAAPAGHHPAPTTAPSGGDRQAWPQVPADLRRLPLLSAVQEVELAHAIEAGVLAQEQLDCAALDPLLAVDLRRLVHLGRQAHDQMVLANLRLVHFWARRRWTAGGAGGLALEDLVSEGTVGLLRAVQKFDFTLGFKFSTYASWWIRQRMQRAAARSTAATLDSRTLESLARFHAAQEDLTVRLRRPPTAAELAAELGTTARAVRELQSAAQRAVSLSTPLTARDGLPGRQLGDLLPDATGDGADAAISTELTVQVQALLRQLPDRQRRVLRLRFGLGCDPHSVEQAAALLGVTEAMVRAALQDALTRLRGAAGVEGLHVFLEAA